MVGGQIGVVEQTYYRWRKQYGGMGETNLKQRERIKHKTIENRRLLHRKTLRAHAARKSNLRVGLFQSLSCEMRRRPLSRNLRSNAIDPVSSFSPCSARKIR
ncbi:transposase [Sulfitobacter sp. MF3-043]|uniref:transposase n=1 Tax=Sulfitobacter sediminivivens TaxID=3252902 RepID=UPI0036DBA58D